MAAVEERKLFPELEEGAKEQGATTKNSDLSFIHWGYLNSTLLTDQSKKTKDLTWKTYWVDLCGSTLRLYRDLSLSRESGNFPPPSKVVGPTGEDEKKEAFLVLKKGASVSIPNQEEFRPRRKNKKTEPTRNNVFKLQVINSNNSPVYFFQAPSKGSMYRWISKMEEGIDIADNPQCQSMSASARKPALTYLKQLPSYKRLKEAKLEALESRRFHNVAPELTYSDTKDDTDSGMEGDVEESVEFQEKPPPDPRLEKLLHQLHLKEELLEMLEKGEKAFIGERGELSKVCEFKATTKADYYLVPGYLSTLIPKGTQINILGQLPNTRWRCYVDLIRTSNSDCTESQSTSDSTTTNSEYSERLVGSVPTSLLLELEEKETSEAKRTDLSVLPMGTPDVTPNVSPYPSPPPSPYSPHKPTDSSHDDGTGLVRRRSPTNLQRFVPSMDLSDVDAWEEFVIPSPPSTPVTSRSTTPSLSPSESMETLDATGDDETSDRTSSELSNDIPVSYIGSAPDSEPPVVVLRNKDVEAVKQEEEPKNYSFLVTKKLRQRGISLIVGSSSSEDEDDLEELSTGAYKAKISRRKLDQEFERIAAESNDAAVVRPYSAFVPRKTTQDDFTTRPKNTVNLRTATTDDLLKDYSSSHNNIPRSKTLQTLHGRASSPENAPPVNQRRTILLSRGDKEGFGFTLQTYGIVQQNGEVEYMTFILEVEEDGPAYMAGMRPGDIIISIESQDVEEADHKTIVSLLQNTPSTVRMVVVFVDAIRRMHLNTKIKVLWTELHNKEGEFKHLCRKEREILTRSGDSGVLTGNDIDLLRPTRTDSESYLYTTELTSSFSKDTRKVKDSVVKYRQHVDDNKPRPASLPDHSHLTKQRLISTTGTQLLKSFASSADSILKKSASIKLKKKVQKTKQVTQTFRSYLEDDEEREGPIDASSPKHSNSKPTRLSSPTNSQSNLTMNQGKTSRTKKSEHPDVESEQCSQMSNSDSISLPIDASMFPNSNDCSMSQSQSAQDSTFVGKNKDLQSFPVEKSRMVVTSPNDSTSQSSSLLSFSSEDKSTTSKSNESATGLVVSENDTEQEKTAILTRGTTNEDTKTTNCSDNIQNENNEKVKIDNSSMRPNTDRKTTSLDCETAGVDRTHSNNFASLRKMFETTSSSTKVQEDTDVFTTDCRPRPQFPRTRLGSRPMSYMRAMDAAEESPLMPDQVGSQRRKDDSRYESSA